MIAGIRNGGGEKRIWRNNDLADLEAKLRQCGREAPKIIAFESVFFQAEDGIRDKLVTGVQTCALPICRVRAQAQAVEDERIEAAQHVERAGRNLAQVGGVGEVVEAVGHDGQATVYDLDRRDEQIGAETELRAVFDRVRDDLRQAAAEVRRLEDVLEDAADVRPGAPVGVDSQSAVAEVQGAYVVESEDVVGVAVRDENGVEVLDVLTKRLLPEIGRRVNEYRLAVVLDEHGDAQAFVARVVRRARLALAADGGHAGRSARA